MKGKKTVKVYDIPDLVKEKGMRMDHFLKAVGIGRVHFYLIRKGDRPLLDERKQIIESILDIHVSK